jgi:hypothetical protein
MTWLYSCVYLHIKQRKSWKNKRVTKIQTKKLYSTCHFKLFFNVTVAWGNFRSINLFEILYPKMFTTFLSVKGAEKSLLFSSTSDMVTLKSRVTMASATVCFWSKTSPGVSFYVKYKEPNRGKGFDIFQDKSVQRCVPQSNFSYLSRTLGIQYVFRWELSSFQYFLFNTKLHIKARSHKRFFATNFSFW